LKTHPPFPAIKEIVYQPAGDILQFWAATSGRSAVNEYLVDGVYVLVDIQTSKPVGFEIIEFSRLASKTPELAELWAALGKMPSSDEIVIRLDETGAAQAKRLIPEYA
jgi:hypothetical protein